jgi:hypothetical protein
MTRGEQQTLARTRAEEQRIKRALTDKSDTEGSNKSKQQDTPLAHHAAVRGLTWARFSDMAERALTHVNRYNTRMHDRVANQQAPLGWTTDKAAPTPGPKSVNPALKNQQRDQ